MHTVSMEQGLAIQTRERRQWPRIKVAVQTELRVIGHNFPIRVKTTDLSMGGCYVEMMFTLELGTKINIVLWMGTVKLSTQGRVVTRHPQFGNGIQFENLTPTDELCLDAFLKRAEREVPQ